MDSNELGQGALIRRPVNIGRNATGVDLRKKRRIKEERDRNRIT